MAERARIASKKTDYDTSTLTIEFVDGAAPLTAVLSELPKDILAKLALHGLSQKLGDSYSGEKLPSEARNSASDVLDRLKNGEWTSRRERSGIGSISLTVEAIAALKGIPAEEVKRVWDGLDDDTRKALRADAAIKAKMAEIKAARLAERAGEESSDLLASFGTAA